MDTSENNNEPKFNFSDLLQNENSKIIFSNLSSDESRHVNGYFPIAIKNGSTRFFDELFFRSDFKRDVNTFERRIKILRKAFNNRMPKTDFNNFAFLVGIDVLEIVKNNSELFNWDNLDIEPSELIKAKHQRKLSLLKANNPDDSIYRDLYHQVDGFDYTIENWRDDCKEANVDYEAIEKAYSLQLSPTSKIRLWLKKNLTDEMSVSEIKAWMIEEGIITENQWGIAAKVASEEGYSGGKKGYWQSK